MERSVSIVSLLIIQLLAFWPVLRWYVLRIWDTSDESWGLVALGTAVLFIILKKAKGRALKVQLIFPTILLLFYCAMFHFIPPLLRAVIAVIAIGCTLSSICSGKAFQPGICGLLLLSLPVIPSMQFYLGYPQRVVAGTISSVLIQLTGFPVIREGTALNWCGKLIWIDAPCSGIGMLWTGFYLTFTLAAFYGLGTKKTFVAALFSLFAIVAGNVLRSASLFYVEAGIFILPWWGHQGVGIVTFLLTAILISWFMQKMREEIKCGISLCT